MSKPPKEIDGAVVLYWAWSGSSPFGILESTDGTVRIEVYGLAICRYPGSKSVYRFSCDSVWEIEQDAEYSSEKEAMDQLPTQYRNTEVRWIKAEDGL